MVTVATSNVAAQSSYSGDLKNYVSLEPKTKLTAFAAIDAFTPFIEETRDSEPIVLADMTPNDLIVAKKNPISSEPATAAPADDSATAAPAAPVERTAVENYEIVPGDTLLKIASKYNLTTGSIEVENPSLTDTQKLVAGDILKIPPKNYDSTYVASVKNARAAKLAAATKTTAKKTLVASTAATQRAVTVRETSDERYDSAGQPDFQRPAGARGQNGYHSWAIDIPPSGGTTISAAASGVVVEVASGWNGGYGNKIVIDHGSGWQTLYGHLSSISVSAGQKVSAGSVIGIMGATGRTYPVGAVHLHFEIRKGGSRLNPINFIN